MCKLCRCYCCTPQCVNKTSVHHLNLERVFLVNYLHLKIFAVSFKFVACYYSLGEKIILHFSSLLRITAISCCSKQPVVGLIPGSVKSETVSPTACQHCDVSSELCYSSAKPRRLVSPLVTRFGVKPRI